MEKIIQGSNDPLILEVDGELGAVKVLSAGLYSYGVSKKIWTYEDVTISNNIIVLPLSEADTLNLSRGPITLDIKGLTEAGEVIFMDLVDYRVIERNNKTILTPVENE